MPEQATYMLLPLVEFLFEFAFQTERTVEYALSQRSCYSFDDRVIHVFNRNRNRHGRRRKEGCISCRFHRTCSIGVIVPSLGSPFSSGQGPRKLAASPIGMHALALLLKWATRFSNAKLGGFFSLPSYIHCRGPTNRKQSCARNFMSRPRTSSDTTRIPPGFTPTNASIQLDPSLVSPTFRSGPVRGRETKYTALVGSRCHSGRIQNQPSLRPEK